MGASHSSRTCAAFPQHLFHQRFSSASLQVVVLTHATHQLLHCACVASHFFLAGLSWVRDGPRCFCILFHVVLKLASHPSASSNIGVKMLSSGLVISEQHLSTNGFSAWVVQKLSTFPLSKESSAPRSTCPERTCPSLFSAVRFFLSSR